MEYPKISIVTPNFNGAEFLEETIISVLSQNYPNLEYIIIDGASSDESLGIIKKYESSLALWISEPDEGMYHAIQKGFEKSSGDIMAWINSDDMYHRNALFSIAEIFSSYSEVEWVLGATTIFDVNSRTVIINKSRSFSKYDFLNEDYGWIQQESVFWRRSLWDRQGATLNLKLKFAGDFALWLSFISHAKLYVTTALIGGFRWQGKNQLSIENKSKYLEEVKFVYSSLKINESEKNILFKYKVVLSIIKLVSKFKVFRTDWILRKFKQRYFGPDYQIIYDPNLLKFVIKPYDYS
jgi:glycosyltransferase involved in cell wall biosynthesis